MNDDGSAVEVRFDYDAAIIERIKRLDSYSRRYVPPDKGGPYWRLRRDLETMRELRSLFGRTLRLGPRLKRWGFEAVARDESLRNIALANDGELERVPNDFNWVERDGLKRTLRPYQRADIKFMSMSSAINANQPGAGKTVEAILALAEAEMLYGFHLVVAPVAALYNVWHAALDAVHRALGHDLPIIATGETPNARRAAIHEAKQMADDGAAFWLVINPALLRMRNVYIFEGEEIKKKDIDYLTALQRMMVQQEQWMEAPELLEIDWHSVTIDEFHLMGLSNPQTLGSKAARRVIKETNPARRYVMSGTPIGGKPIKLWGALNFLDPVEFSSKWMWAGRWLEIKRNNYGAQIEGLKPGIEKVFDEKHAAWMIRRTKREALPGLPPKQHINVWCSMTKAQSEQYHVFAQKAEWKLDEAKRLTATNILAEYTRLKQFADAYCEVSENGNGLLVEHTSNSGKLEQLMEKLGEEGVLDGDAQALVYSQFNAMVAVAARELEKHGLNIEVLTGATKANVKHHIEPRFQSGEIDVLVMNVMAGTALNLSRADSVHLLDESWVPDHQEQAEDRAHRGDAITMAKDEVRVYTYRTAATIEEHVMAVVAGKKINNQLALDLRKRMKEAA